MPPTPVIPKDASALRHLASQCADDLLAAGAVAVVLVGSVALGSAGPGSDIDLIAVTERPDDVSQPQQQVRSRRVVNVDIVTPAGVRAAFAVIPDALAVVPGWQHADILADPHGVARAIRGEAAAWSFDGRTDEIGRWAAGVVTGLAEELQKTRNVSSSAARLVNATLVLLQLSGPMLALAGRHYRSENELWDLAAEVMGAEWEQARDRVLGLGLPADPTAAAILYRSAAARVEPWLTSAQRQVIDLASFTPE